MFEGGNRAARKSRAPYFLVGAVCIAIVAAAVMSNRYQRDDAPSPSPIQADQATPAIGTPPARNGTGSIAERSAAMNVSRQERRAERMQKLHDARLDTANRFEQEPVDSTWSAGKETRLQALAESPTYQQAGIVPESLQIDCRSTLCKITANHASYGASADWAMIFLTSSAGEVTRTFSKTINNADGSTSVEIYAQAR